VAATLVLAALAGILSILSPCVLPLVPIVLATALGQHRLGPAALAAGLTVSFTAVGLFIATIGYAIGLEADTFRAAGAVVILLIGLALLVPSLQARFALAAGPVGDWTQRRFGNPAGIGLPGQFGVGLLLGVVWSPCVGPTLGAASAMAARGENLGAVALTMLAFGLGAALPLLALGSVSRGTRAKWRGGLMAAGRRAKMALGVLLVALAVLMLSGADRNLESWLVEHSPEWLTRLSTSL
jgi:cytochrome c-type biogenesis protein